MIDGNLFDLPSPLPSGVLYLGPDGWRAADEPAGPDSVVFHDPAAALAWLRAAAAGDAAATSRLVVVHQDAFAGAEGAGLLAGWLEDVAGLRAPLLPVLLHGNLPGVQLVEFFRAGLFDALAVPVSRAAWVNMLIRAEKRLERRHRGRLLLADSGRTREALLKLRHELGDPAGSPAELLRACDSLEAANIQLTSAMAELSLLYRFGRELSVASNWDAVLREILSNLTEFVGASGASLVLRSATGGRYSARQTWQWEETAWDKVLVSLQDQVDGAVAESIVAPGVFSVDPNSLATGEGKRLIALPLEHEDVRLGYLLLLFISSDEREAVSRRYLPFLQTIQVVLSEEIAGAQRSDRIRDVGTFNARVLETISSAIWVIDERGRTVYCNRAGQEMLTGQSIEGPAPDELLFRVGRGREDASDARTVSGLPELFLDGLLSAKTVQGSLLAMLRDRPAGVFGGDAEIRRSDGVGLPVHLQTSLMPGRLPGESWLVVVAEDLRPARRLETERLRTERLEALVEMSATLAHEIRNPLMGLSAQAELLAGQMPTGDRRSRYLDVITREVDRINETITRMLNYVRPYEPVLAMCRLWETARDAADLVRPRAEAAGIDLVVDASGEPDPAAVFVVRADGGQIKQVLLNLLINAVDAAPEGGHVALRLSWGDRFDLPNRHDGTLRRIAGVSLEVSDDGPGFRDGDLSRIFRPFYTTKSSGTGLGLSLCHKIVAAHDGEIRAERRDEWTVFRVVLPAASAADVLLTKGEAS